MSARRADAIIVGAGIVGAACAVRASPATGFVSSSSTPAERR
jgi:glycerol-3-phosphate dehydrogenase